MNRIDTPLGDPVSSQPATVPTQITLVGRYCRLRPLEPAHDAPALFGLTHGDANRDGLWTYLPYGPFADRTSFERWMQANAASKDPVFFAIEADGAIVGQASLLRITPEHRVVEVGHILYSPALQRTRAATEAMYLLAHHVFETLDYRRYEWKCNALNAPSRAAALRLGFTYEGTFRQHLITKGRNRDTAWYSMLDHEWPARRVAFERWLDPANFDEHGRQRVALSMQR